MSPASDGPDDVLWEAVAEPSRRRLLDLLLVHGPATPTRLAAELPITRQAVAKHLAVLARAGLVQAQRLGREVHYAVNAERLAVAAQAMARAAEQWDRRLRRIKHLAEAAHPRAATHAATNAVLIATEADKSVHGVRCFGVAPGCSAPLPASRIGRSLPKDRS